MSDVGTEARTGLVKKAAPPAPPSAPRVLPVLLVLFVGSGCSALIYEIVWFQMLQLVIGSAAVSLGVLLGTFMGGMCLGSWLLPRVVSVRRHPLRVYAALELGIGAMAVALLYGMPHIEKVYVSAAGGGWALSLVLRGAVSVLCLLPPTVLMGGTLPAVARWVRTTREEVSWLGFLYGGNIAGAVVGCLAAGFYLLRLYDAATATFAAVAVNAAVSAIALALAAGVRYRPAAEPSAPFDTARKTAMSPTAHPLPMGASGKSGRPAADAAPAGPRGSRLVYVAIALSGLTALGAEVVWTRLLSLLLGGTVYTFSIILAVFLLGLGMGSTAGSFLARRARPRLALGFCQLLLGAAIAWTAYALSSSLPFWPVNPEISLSPWHLFQMDVMRCLWAVLPGAVLWGASFPLALGAAAAPGQDPGRLVGGVYAANTIGAIVGSLAFSMLVIPAIGTQWSERALVALTAVSAALVLWPRGWGSPAAAADLPPPRTPRPALAGLAALFVVTPFLVWSIAPMPWGAVAFGRHCATWVAELYPGVLDEDQVALLKQAETWRLTLRLAGDQVEYESWDKNDAERARVAALEPALKPWLAEHEAELRAALRAGQRLPGEARTSAAFGGGSPSRYCTFVGEGVNSSVAVTESSAGWRHFHGAGKVQASTDPQDMRLQRMLGHLPMLARKDPDSVRTVLVVACGAGVTAGAYVPYDSVRRIVICDIEPMVFKHVAPRFAEANHHVLSDPRTRAVVDDGRHFLRTTRETFDVITSDPIDPWVKGCAALSTVEYYELCKARLNPGGVMALWFPLYEANFESVKSAIATFFKVFPDGVIWSNDTSGEGYDVVLFGRVPPAEPIHIDRLEEWLNAHPKVLASVEDVGFGSRAELVDADEEIPETSVDLLATYAGRARDLAAWTRGAPLNTDRNLRLQYLAGLALNNDLRAAIFKDILAHYRFPADLIQGSPGRLAALRRTLEAAGRKKGSGTFSGKGT